MFGFKKILAQKPVATVEMVHDEIDELSDELIRQAEKVLQSEPAVPQVEKGIADIGFGNIKNVRAEKEANSELYAKALIAKYRQNYPQYKFITEELINALCAKYGLVYAEAKYFEGEMPVENQREVLNFQIKSEDNPGYGRAVNFKVIAKKEEFSSLIRDQERPAGVYELKDRDPIVLAQVRGGYLIVSKWGAEAKLPEVQIPERN